MFEKFYIQGQRYLNVAATLSILAGMLHATVIAFEHVAPLPLETMFFWGGGMVQLLLAIRIIRACRLKYVLALFVVNGGMVCVWLLTRILRAPFMDGPEGVSPLGVFIMILELISIGVLVFWKWKQKHHIESIHGMLFRKVIASAIISSIFLGGGVYAGGLAGEYFLPERSLSHGHAEDDAHDKADVFREDEGVDHDDDDMDNAPAIKRQKKKERDVTNDHVDEVPHD